MTSSFAFHLLQTFSTLGTILRGEFFVDYDDQEETGEILHQRGPWSATMAFRLKLAASNQDDGRVILVRVAITKSIDMGEDLIHVVCVETVLTRV